MTADVLPLRRPVRAAPTRLRVALLAVEAWYLLVAVRFGLLRRPLPDLVARLGRPAPARPDPVAPVRLGHLVGRVLRVGPWRPRCLFGALVLYRLARRQGDAVELVIGLSAAAPGKDAHAWVEWNGVDVGPPPGGRRHVELARFG